MGLVRLYLFKAFNEPLPQDGMVLSANLDLYLNFIEGVLVDYSSADGLILYAKDWSARWPDVFDLYFKEAIE